MSPFHAAEILALLTFLIACASFHRVLGRASTRSSSSYLPSPLDRSPHSSGRSAAPGSGRSSQPVIKSSRSPSSAFRVVRMRGELTLVPDRDLPLKKAA